ncbi:MAG: hypothetical protein IAC58_07035 [Firmicutes bacterium]|uniref:Uncharacterized protein n=1 Tax=Candidatus Onthovivens merdipullorum TaxID=2840889 RepID=A0A9D9DNG9_9BACL|nr:hypothetical protein [Candidatus Onthovivens merdipullorum]
MNEFKERLHQLNEECQIKLEKEDIDKLKNLLNEVNNFQGLLIKILTNYDNVNVYYFDQISNAVDCFINLRSGEKIIDLCNKYDVLADNMNSKYDLLLNELCNKNFEK